MFLFVLIPIINYSIIPFPFIFFFFIEVYVIFTTFGYEFEVAIVSFECLATTDFDYLGSK